MREGKISDWLFPVLFFIAFLSTSFYAMSNDFELRKRELDMIEKGIIKKEIIVKKK